MKGLDNFEGAAKDQASKHTRDLIAHAKESDWDPVVGREAELNRLLAILKRRHKNHPLIVGEPGVG
jgi:ATP-dependent Clp protease ATP-binding subunit ClpB